MMKNIIQIENVTADELFTRLERMESAITAFSGTPQPLTAVATLSDYITRRDVATLFKITLTTVHDWTRKGLLQAYKVANRVYYKRSEVESALVKKGGLYA